MKLFPCPILVIDTETSGLPQHPGARPIEVAAVVVGTDGAILEEYSSLVRSHEEPEPPVHAQFALNLTGIRWEEVLSAPPVDQVLADLEALAGRHSTRWIAAYNRDFDREMMRRIGWGGDWRWCSDIMLKAMVPWMVEAKVLAHSDPWHWQHDPNLPYLFPPLCPNGKGKVSVAEFFGVTIEGDAHRALCDARVAAKVMAEIHRRCMARAAEGKS